MYDALLAEVLALLPQETSEHYGQLMDDAMRPLVCDRGGNRAESSLPDQRSLLCLAMLRATMAPAQSSS
jgi:hypothetical protein